MKDTPDQVAAGQAALKSANWPAAKLRFETALQAADTPEAHDGLGLALWWLNDIRASHELRAATARRAARRRRHHCRPQSVRHRHARSAAASVGLRLRELGTQQIIAEQVPACSANMQRSDDAPNAFGCYRWAPAPLCDAAG